MSNENKPEIIQVTFPVGRVINASLFEKDKYVDPKGREATPSYKIEMAYDPKDVCGQAAEGQPPTVEDWLIEAAVRMWGDTDAIANGIFDGSIINPLLSGDELAARREAKGKPGDAYKGKIIIRANSIFNAEGVDGPGGVYVCGPDAVRINPAARDQVYNGCYGIVIANVSCYIEPGSRTEQKGLKFYLVGFQKTDDGERLSTVDRSVLFKPVGRPVGVAAMPARRKR